MTEQTAREFYGAAYDRAKDKEKLEKAFLQLGMALRSQSDGVQTRALELAAKTEAGAFA
jgi:hypothetical protein